MFINMYHLNLQYMQICGTVPVCDWLLIHSHRNFVHRQDYGWVKHFQGDFTNTFHRLSLFHSITHRLKERKKYPFYRKRIAMQTSERTDLKWFIVKTIYKYSKRYLAFTKNKIEYLFLYESRLQTQEYCQASVQNTNKCHKTKCIK